MDQANKLKPKNCQCAETVEADLEPIETTGPPERAIKLLASNAARRRLSAITHNNFLEAVSVRDAELQSLKPVFGPSGLSAQPLIWQVAAVLLGTGVLALSSHIQVPMVPVPITMQTFAVTLIGALYGWRLGTVTVVAWLLQGAFGMPVLAGGAAGLHRFVGPTAGYLFAFPIAAALCGWLVERGWNGQRPLLSFVAMLIGNAACLVLGGMWLAAMIGVDKAISLGVAPFLVGAVLKSALGAAILALLARRAAPRLR